MKMGFATQQGSNSTQQQHEAFVLKQESELRLIETMKKCMQMKLRYDRDYAASLLQVVGHGQKIDGLDNSINDSSLLQAWKSMLEDYEFLAKLIKQNSDAIEAKVIDRLNLLFSEKRKLKKSYADEHGRLSTQLIKMTDDVTRKKIEYQKNLELFKVLRSRYEDIHNKGFTGKFNKKIEEAKEKYYKQCKKLHLIHNEYILLLAEAVEFEKDYRTVLLPGLQEVHQTIQETLAEEWKSILEDIAKNSSLCTEQFRDLENRIFKIVEGIRPLQECAVHLDKVRSPIITETIFTFDNHLVDNSLNLEPNKLVVDSLTIDWLRSRLTELDANVKAEQEKMLQLGEHILSVSRTHNSDKNVQTEISRKRRELVEMRCDERKLMRQLDIVKNALNGQVLQELPTGWECDGIDVNDSTTQVEFEERSVISRPPSSQSLQKKSFSTIFNRVKLRATPTSLRKVASRPTPERENSSVRTLFEEEWFHGVLPREEVVRLLRKEGDFLLRETTRNEENQTVLSVAWGGHKHFIVQTTPEGLYRFEGPAFPTIQELIIHQFQSGLPVTARSGAVLKKPILRERWELNNDDVILLDKIGRGNFGDVYKARLKKSRQEVAVKTCRMTLPDEQKKKFLQEGRILKQYDHPNVVKLVGICVQKQPIMIVMELVPGGSLLTFLRNNAAVLTELRLLRMCRDVAAGMRYLESKNCIHRDLAARNCLIGNNEIVKISDFGMSREEEEYIVSDGMKQIPIKWTAPEALNFGKYTSLCDVWSYGVLAWEVFARGDVPYPGLSNTKAREKIDSGYRMAAAEGTPEEMYKLMLRCWEYEPENRPHFDEIHKVIQEICNKLYPNE